jgi:hypothetical protein
MAAQAALVTALAELGVDDRRPVPNGGVELDGLALVK